MSSDSGAPVGITPRRPPVTARRLVTAFRVLAFSGLAACAIVSCTTTWAPVPPRLPEGSGPRVVRAPVPREAPPPDERRVPEESLEPRASSAPEALVSPEPPEEPPRVEPARRPRARARPIASAEPDTDDAELAGYAREDTTERARASRKKPQGSPRADDVGLASDDETASPSPTLRKILAAIEGYARWPRFPENEQPLMSASHDGTWVVAHYNDVVAEAMRSPSPLPLPDGAILVKENRASRDGAPKTLTLMSKQGRAWYWAEVTPEGRVVVDNGAPVEGTDVRRCVACHEAARANDLVFTHPFRAAP